MQVQQMYPEEQVVQYNNLYFNHEVRGEEHIFTAKSFFIGPDHETRDLVVVVRGLPDEYIRKQLMDPLSTL